MGYRRILAGTDGSETATASVRTAARLAKRFRSQLLVVSAYEAPAFTADQAQRALDGAADVAREEGVEAQIEILLGRIGDVLLDRARRRGVELIVIGNRGIGPAKRMGLGSLADRVAHDAPCDLLIVNTAGPGRRSEELYRSMLVGTDGSATAGEAVRKAYELAMVLKAVCTSCTSATRCWGRSRSRRPSRPSSGRPTVAHGLEGDPVDRLLGWPSRKTSA
jgi:nucleotide-binding universal stress UspA family protein